jgi:hypothetical protein
MSTRTEVTTLEATWAEGSRPRRLVEVTVLVAAWIAIGLVLGLNTATYLFLGVGWMVLNSLSDGGRNPSGWASRSIRGCACWPGTWR